MADPVRPLVLIAAIEAIAGLAVLVADVIAVVQGTQGLSGAGSGTEVAGVVLWLILVAGLGLVWFGLFRRRRLGLAPFLLVQAFVLVVVPLFLGSDRAAYRFVGVALGLMAVVGVILGLRPSARAALH
jgi:xanthine/uracil/vitamin C permease (AzgA family)